MFISTRTASLFKEDLKKKTKSIVDISPNALLQINLSIYLVDDLSNNIS